MNNIEYNEIVALMALPNDVPFTSNEAAIFLRCSLSSLEVMRRDGTGPKYSQPIRRKGGGVNRRCLYVKRDLISWIESGMVGSVREATVRNDGNLRP